MDKKEIEITVDKNNKVDLKDFIEMKIKYDVEYQEKDKEIERLENIIKEVREVIEEKCREEIGGIAWYIKNILDKGEIK